MNSVNRLRPAKQFRCQPLVGRESPFGYVEIVRSEAGGHNYQGTSELVEAFTEMNERGRNEWLKLTGGLKTTEASMCGLSGGNPKPSALFTCGKGMSMSASARSNNSSESLQS